MRPARLFPLLILLPTLAACSGTDLARSFGLSRNSPNEFLVTTRAPLSMPSSFSLQPPRPGAPRPQEMSASRSAEAVLVPQTALSGPAAMGPAQQAFVKAAGPAAPPDIRQLLAQDANATPSLTDRLMFWKSAKPKGVVVNAQAEARRLQENAALGRPPTAGVTPIIQPDDNSGFLGSLF